MKFHLFLLSVILFSCKTVTDAANQQAVDAKPETTEVKPVISFERTHCFGKCPVYQVKVYNNGKVFYHGQANVEQIGDFEGKANINDVQSLLELAKKVEFNTFQEKYNNNVSDLPACITGIDSGDGFKTVERKGKGPEGLKQLELAIDALITTTKLKKVNE